jgi:branched-chain amino acid transport system ATP-binding protein
MLKIANLNAFYNRIQALRNVTLEIPQKKIVSIIGSNGAGKTTLLKSISGLVRSKSGQILYRERDISNLAPDRIVSLGISQVPEGRQLFSHLTVQENIELGAYPHYRRSSRRTVLEWIRSMYAMFPILETRSKQIAGTLSGGEQQMLAIARALMAKPDLLLLDEPSMGIAPLIVREIFEVIRRLNQQGTTILLIEQNARAALQVSHYSYVLERGEIALEGIASELLGNPKVREVYLGG